MGLKLSEESELNQLEAGKSSRHGPGIRVDRLTAEGERLVSYCIGTEDRSWALVENRGSLSAAKLLELY